MPLMKFLLTWPTFCKNSLVDYNMLSSVWRRCEVQFAFECHIRARYSVPHDLPKTCSVLGTTLACQGFEMKNTCSHECQSQSVTKLLCFHKCYVTLLIQKLQRYNGIFSRVRLANLLSTAAKSAKARRLDIDPIHMLPNTLRVTWKLSRGFCVRKYNLAVHGRSRM